MVHENSLQNLNNYNCLRQSRCDQIEIWVDLIGISIPSDPGFYYHIYKKSGTPTITAAYLVGVRRG